MYVDVSMCCICESIYVWRSTIIKRYANGYNPNDYCGIRWEVQYVWYAKSVSVYWNSRLLDCINNTLTNAIVARSPIIPTMWHHSIEISLRFFSFNWLKREFVDVWNEKHKNLKSQLSSKNQNDVEFLFIAIFQIKFSLLLRRNIFPFLLLRHLLL